MVALKPVFMHSLKTSSLTVQTTTQCVSEAFFTPENGARYLNPQTGLWLSTDPAMGEYVPQAPINDDAKKYNQSLAGMGGVFNVVNLHVYHYAGNNPVVLVDPDGRTLNDDGTVTYDPKVHNTLDKMAKAAGWKDWKAAVKGDNEGAIFRKGTSEISVETMASWHNEDGTLKDGYTLEGVTMSNVEPDFSRRPVPGIVRSLRGMRSNPFTGKGQEFHEGVDLRATEGTPVHTSAFGVVAEVAKDTRIFGTYVVIRHGSGYTTRYAHLSRIWYSVGTVLHNVTELGLSGNTGRSTAPHLDYTMFRHGKSVDPGIR